MCCTRHGCTGRCTPSTKQLSTHLEAKVVDTDAIESHRVANCGRVLRKSVQDDGEEVGITTRAAVAQRATPRDVELGGIFHRKHRGNGAGVGLCNTVVA